MATAVNMPQLGESVTEGTVTRWLKNVGDRVQADEPLLEVSTDKVDTEIPSPVDGVLLEISVVEDDVVPVGAQLGTVGEPSELMASPPPPRPVAAPVASQPNEPQTAAPPTTSPTVDTPPTTSPTVETPLTTSPTATPPPAAPPPVDTPSGEVINIELPALGESVTEGTVTRWLKHVGDPVVIDEPVLEVSTDKVDTEIPAPAAGRLSAILVLEDETVPVGTVLGTVTIGSTAPSAPSDAPTEAAAPIPAEPLSTQAPPPPATPAAPAGVAPSTRAAPEPPAGQDRSAPGRHRATPLVRKLARESGVDLDAVPATGVGGRVTRADLDQVLHAAPDQASTTAGPPADQSPQTRPHSGPSPSPRKGLGRDEPMPRLRRVIADRMVESLRVAAQLTSVVEIDLTHVARQRSAAQAEFTSREGARLTFLPFFMRATVDALKAHPVLNASVGADAATVAYHDAVHLGVAVDTNRGLLVPVIHNAGDLTLAGLAHRVADLAERTRTGRVSPDDLSGGTFTISNTGSRGSLFDTPIINLPQVGILGTGAVVRRPVVVTGPTGEDAIAIRSMAFFALTYDHRLVDGADAARFLGTIKETLESAPFESELGL